MAFTEIGREPLASQRAWPVFYALCGAAAVMFAITIHLPLGPLSGHMAKHIVLMNIAGPLFALAIATRIKRRKAASKQLALPTVVQLATLWAWHTPAAFAFSHHSGAVALSMHSALFLSAVWFWSAVIQQSATERWRSVAALLITGKVFCLLGALLTFAPVELYRSVTQSVVEHGTSLYDQQFAGLLMLTACPVTYVLAGIVVAVRWLNDLAGMSDRAPEIPAVSIGFWLSDGRHGHVNS